MESSGFFIARMTDEGIFSAMPSYRTAVGRVRIVGMLEGVSFLLLMGVAMPLKYFAGMPEAVKWAGWTHGMLFVAYALVVLTAWTGGSLSFGKSALAFVASLLPFGPFVIDRKLESADATGVK